MKTFSITGFSTGMKNDRRHFHLSRLFKYCIYAFFLPVIIMFIVIIGKSIYPFGSNCFLRTDMYHQYLPFMCEFHRKLVRGGSLDFSWTIGLGSNFSALYAYYLASPVNWLCALCPTHALIEFMTVLIVIKIGLCGASCCYYLSKHFDVINDSMVMFSLFYSLSGFMAAYNWNIMWLDSVALAPLVILGLEKLVSEGKWKYYCVTLALCVLANYYISIMICIFLILYFIILILYLPWKQKLRALLQFAFASLLAACLASIVIVPGIMALTGTKFTGNTFPRSFEYYFTPEKVLARQCMNVCTDLKNDHWPNIYCGVGVMFLFPLYLSCRSIPLRKKIPVTALLAFFILSFSLNKLNFIWHGLNYPDSLPARQSFLYIIVLITACYEAFLHIHECSIRHIIICAACTAGLVVLFWLRNCNSEHFDPNRAILSTAVFLALYAVLGALYYLHAGNQDFIVSFIFIIALAEVGINTYCTSVSTVSRDIYTDKWFRKETVASDIRKSDSDFFRIDEDDRVCKNDSALSDYMSASLFSSTANGGVEAFYKNIGLDSSKVYYCFDGDTPLTSMLLNVRYFISMSDGNLSNRFRTLVTHENGIYIYKSAYDTALGYMLPSDFDSAWNMECSNSTNVQNAFVHALGIKEDLFTPYTIYTDKNSASVTADQNEHLYMYVTGATSDQCSTINETVTMADGKTATHVLKKCQNGCLMDLGTLTPGDKISLTATAGSLSNVSLNAYQLNDDVMAEALDLLGREKFQVTSYGDNYLNGKIDVKKAGRLFLSIPDEMDWTLYVDGRKTTYETFEDAFISVDLAKGQHDIALKFNPAGKKLGILMTLFGLIIFTAACKIPFRSSKAHVRRRAGSSDVQSGGN
jgi:uncharacterized membrane protein YfhO